MCDGRSMPFYKLGTRHVRSPTAPVKVQVLHVLRAFAGLPPEGACSAGLAEGTSACGVSRGIFERGICVFVRVV